MKRLTPAQLRKALEAAEVAEFKPSTHLETLRDRMDIGTFSAVGWTPPPIKLSREGWIRAGTTILTIERATPWLWGDWYLAIEDRTLPDDWAGPSQRTLANYAVVAMAYHSHERRDDVPFAHHAALTALPKPEQASLLAWCSRQRQRPSLAKLQAEIQRRTVVKLPPPELPKAAPSPAPLRVTPPAQPSSELEIEPPPPAEITIRVTLFMPESLHTWVAEAATGEGVGLGAWIVALIERARYT